MTKLEALAADYEARGAEIERLKIEASAITNKAHQRFLAIEAGYKEKSAELIEAKREIEQLKTKLAQMTELSNGYAADYEATRVEKVKYQAANTELLAACESALGWINRFAEHGPAQFGGEAALAEQLRIAINKALGGTEATR